MMPEEPMMTEAQRDELKTLCQKADVPDKSGELLTQEGAQHFIDDLKEQLAQHCNLLITPLEDMRQSIKRPAPPTPRAEVDTKSR
jgi:predicted ATPase with chaperone activity